MRRMVAGLLTTVLVLLATGSRGIAPAGATSVQAPSLASALGPHGEASATTCSSTGTLKYNGGSVIPSSETYAIFWLPTGYHFESGQDSQPANSQDDSYEALIERFLGDVGGSTYYNILTQYCQTTSSGKQYIGNSSTFGGSYVDATTPYQHFSSCNEATNQYPVGSTKNALTNCDVYTEIENAVADPGGWKGSFIPPTPGFGSVFLLFTADGAQICDPAVGVCTFAPSPTGTEHVCGYHWSEPYTFSPGLPQTTLVYGALASSDTDSGYCILKPQGVAPAPNGDAAADAEVIWTAHELFESVTDPTGTGWTGGVPGGTGSEVADVCQGTFGQIDPTTHSNVVMPNGDKYILQQMWSNAGSQCDLGLAGVPISIGWNLIDLPIQNTTLTSASSLITSLDASLGANTIQLTAIYVGGRFSLNVPGYTSDYQLQPGQGVYVLSRVPGTWFAPGTAFSSGQPVSLQPGWNLVAAPYPSAGLLTSSIVQEAACNVQEIAVYSNGSYRIWTPGTPDFRVDASSGIWILCDTPSTWTPVWPGPAVAWGTPALVHAANGDTANPYPRISVAPSDRIYVSWHDSHNNVLVSSSPSGENNTFTTPVVASTSGTSAERHDLLAGPNGNVYVAWCNRPNVYLTHSVDGGKTFGLPIQLDQAISSPSNGNGCLTDGSGPRIAQAADGTIYVVWSYDNTALQQLIYMVKSADGGATFSSPVAIQPNDFEQETWPSIAVGSNGVLYVAWQEDAGYPFGDAYVARSSDGGATFSSPVRANSIAGVVAAPEVAAYGTNHVYVAWWGWKDGNPNIDGSYFVRSSDGGATFSSDLKVNNTDHVPEITTGPSGQVLMALSGQSSPGSSTSDTFTLLSSDEGTSFGPSTLIAAGGGSPLPRFTSTGEAVAVWENSNLDILVSKGT